MKASIKFIYESKSGLEFKVQPELVSSIESLIDSISQKIQTEKSNGKFVGYLSVPISPRGGADFNTNIEISKVVTANIEKKFGKKLWILNPAEYNLPKEAKGGDYMAVWSDILAGEKGKGDDFDLIYFLGPNDIWDFFQASGNNRIGKIEKWLKSKAQTDQHYKEIYRNAEAKHKFLRFYGIRGSVTYSKGAHDEWNLILKLNEKRPVGDDISIYFDGVPIEPGDYSDPTESGYEKTN